MSVPLITLAAIVGNEEDLIERFIRSFEPAVNEIVLVLAVGNQLEDRTLEIAGRICDELDIHLTYEVYQNREKDWPHVDDFSAARNLSWKIAAETGASYLMWADCDDELREGSAEILRAAAQDGSERVYMVPYHVAGRKQIVYRERMVRNDGGSFWHKPVHEGLAFDGDWSYKILREAAVIHSPISAKSESRSRNRRILEAAVANGAYNLFFLSQEALVCGEMDNFWRYAKAALVHPCVTDLERYEILITMAQNERLCDLCKAYAAEAFAIMPERREALALLATYALVDKKYDEALRLAKIMIQLPRPNKTYWSLNQDWYEWKGFYLLTHAYRRAGQPDKALELEIEQFVKAGRTFSVCHPTYLRPEQALAIRELYISRADNPMGVEYIFGIHHDDQRSVDLLGGYRHTITDKEGCCPNTMEPLRASGGKFVMVVADDLIPAPGWDTQIAKKLASVNAEGFGGQNKHIVLNFNDGLRVDGHMCHAFMTRGWLDEILKDPWPGTGIFSDNEFTHRARKAGVVIDAPEIVFEHRHFTNGKAPLDATYKDQNQRKNYEDGLRLLAERNPDLEVPKLVPEVPVVPINLFPLAVEALVQKKGANLRFVQIGAHDGLHNDPIRAFVEKYHWIGVLVEPQPAIFKRLLANYADEKQLAFENCAIAPIDGQAKFYCFAPNQGLPDHATMLCSMWKEAVTNNGHGYRGEVEQIIVPAMTLQTLLTKHDIESLDILQIDAEGFDFDVIKMLDETAIRPEIIHFEHSFYGTEGHGAIRIKGAYDALARMGYRVSAVGNDTVAMRQEGDNFDKIVRNDGY
jgi:FkbM family methyltransferase